MRTSSPSLRAVSSLVPATAVLLVAVLVLPAALVAASGPNATLQGFIRTGAGSPIAGASIVVTATDVGWVFEATADVAGHYVISLPNHLYTFQASAPAFSVNSTTVRVGSGQTVWFNMTLAAANARSVRVEGFVRDASNSTPIALGRVEVSMPYWASGALYTNSSPLNATGHYAIDVVPGTYVLSTDRVTGYVPYSYSYLYLSAGQVRWYNFSMTPAPPVAWINGTVRDSASFTPLAGAWIVATMGGQPLATTTSNASGLYSVRVPIGSVLLAADAPGHVPDSSQPYVWGAGTFTVDFYLVPLNTGIRGYVRDGLTGLGLGNVVVPPTPFFGGGYYDQAPTNATGYYAVALPSDDYYITVSKAGYTNGYAYAYLGSGTVEWLNITLWPLVSTVKGYLVDGATGAPLASMGVGAYDARSSYSAYVSSDGTGLFAFTLPPSPTISLTVRGVAPYVGAVVYLTTSPYATRWVNITVPRVDAQLTLHVADGITGLPISGASVGVTWQLGGAYATVNASGAAVLGVPSELSLIVNAWAVGYLSWYGTIDPVASTGSFEITLYPALTANVTVQGYVTDALTNGSLTFARVTVSGYGGYASGAYTDGTGFYQVATVVYPQTVRANAYNYASSLASINPSAAGTIWVNLSLSPDANAPLILDYSAVPSANVGPANPTTLTAHVNESDFAGASIALYMMRSSSRGVGTFLNIEQVPAIDVSITTPSPGNETVSTPWDTQTPVALLSDGASTDWWPATMTYQPYQVAIPGYWDNATLAAATYGTAYFDRRSGNLLYVYTPAYGYIAAADQPSSTFQPYAVGLQVNLTTAAIGASTLVTASAFSLAGLRMAYASGVPGGTYASVVQVWNGANHYTSAAVLLQVTADTTPPVARAGPARTVNQGTLVNFDGSASTDNTGITNYTWAFWDGGAKSLYGAVVTYRFLNAGVFAVTLTVRDAAGNAGTGATTVTVRDTTPPIVAFSTPSAGANVSGTVTLSATATDNLGVTRVEFFADGAPVGNATSAPYSIALNTANLANGAHTLTAVAFDAAGNTATATLHIAVSNAPSGGLLGIDSSLWPPLILVMVAAAAIVVIVLLRRRKRPESPSLPPPSPPAN